MQSDDRQKTVSAMVEDLSLFSETLRKLPGLGPSLTDYKRLSRIENSVVEQGRPRSFVEGQPLHWIRTRAALKAEIIGAVSNVGVDAGAALETAKAELNRKIHTSQSQFRELMGGEAGPKGSSIIVRPRVHLGSCDPGRTTKVFYRNIGREHGELKEAIHELELTQKQLADLCLQTGRALAFTSLGNGFVFLHPNDLGTSPDPKTLDQCAFLLSVDLPGALFDPYEDIGDVIKTQRIRRAALLLERMYEVREAMQGRPRKDQLRLIFTDVFKISATAFDQKVWATTNIKEWKRSGRRTDVSEVSINEIRMLVENLNNQ